MGLLSKHVRLAGRAAWMAAGRFYRGHDLTFASSIAYYALLSIFPFFLLLFSILGAVTANDAARGAVADFVLRHFPRQFDFVVLQLDVLRQQHVQLGVLSALLTAWAALGVFGAITTAVNYAWDVQRHPNYFQHKLVSFLMLLAAGALLVSILVVLSLQQIVDASWVGGALEGLPWVNGLRSLAARSSVLVAAIVVAGLLFYFVPNADVRLRDVWLGAVITGLLWRASLFGVSWYGGNPSRPSVHGSIATVVLFLVWVYFSAIVLLFGVEFTAAYARLRLAERDARRAQPRGTEPVPGPTMPQARSRPMP